MSIHDVQKPVLRTKIDLSFVVLVLHVTFMLYFFGGGGGGCAGRRGGDLMVVGLTTT